MSKRPRGMKREEHDGEYPHFDPNEYLFRRVPLALWSSADDPVEVDAVELPDMSVGRSRFGHPEWVRFDVVNNVHFEDWGVIGFRVRSIHPRFWVNGIEEFTFEPCHDPLEQDYPHTEVRVFLNGQHVPTLDGVPEDIHLKWREMLLREVERLIRPEQVVPVRDDRPTSHVLEPLPQA